MARSAGEQPGRRPSGDRGSSSPALVFKDAGAGARAERATGAGGAGPSLHKSKDVPRFAPNFSVYLLPPETVCLYSEDRKFFLHGELYCALALAIGEGKRSFREIVGALEQRFPSDKIQEALKRLIDRRYVVTASRARAPARRDRGVLGEPRAAAGSGGGKSPQMSRAHSIDRRARRQGTRRRSRCVGRARGEGRCRADRHVGERLS